jgi:predicted ArsR family transcriptional regulator
MLRQQLLDTGRGRIVSLLQRGPLTVDDIASKLELRASGVRAQITAMERDGVVRRIGRRPGTTRPSRIFELTPEVEQLLSRAYIPLLTQLVDVFANGRRRVRWMHYCGKRGRSSPVNFLPDAHPVLCGPA